MWYPRGDYAAFITSGKYGKYDIHYHFQVVFTSGELGNFKASPFVPLSVLRDVIEGTEEGRKNHGRGPGGRLGPPQGPGAEPR